MAELMTSVKSLIADFYPQQFGLDLNGKKYLWQGVVLLPFIDEYRLFRAARGAEPDLSVEEKRRNTLGCEYVFFNSTHPLLNSVCSMHTKLATARQADLTPEELRKCDRTVPNEGYDALVAATTLDIEKVYDDLTTNSAPPVKHVRGMADHPVVHSFHSRLTPVYTADHVKAALTLRDRCCEHALASDASPARRLVDWKDGDGLYGYISPMFKGIHPMEMPEVRPPFQHPAVQTIKKHHVYSCVFSMPTTYKHSSKLLPSLVAPPSVLHQRDIEDVTFAVPDRFAHTIEDLQRITEGGSVYAPKPNRPNGDSIHSQAQNYGQAVHNMAFNKGYGFAHGGNIRQPGPPPPYMNQQQQHNPGSRFAALDPQQQGYGYQGQGQQHPYSQAMGGYQAPYGGPPRHGHQGHQQGQYQPHHGHPQHGQQPQRFSHQHPNSGGGRRFPAPPPPPQRGPGQRGGYLPPRLAKKQQKRGHGAPPPPPPPPRR
jgi:hypothetical protein